MLSLRNESIIEVENRNRELRDNADKLETELLSWKLHATRADNSMVTQDLAKSFIMIAQTVHPVINIKETQEVTDKKQKDDCSTKQIPPAVSNSSNHSDSKREEIHRERSTISFKERVLLIGTSNVRYRSSKYISGDRYKVRKELSLAKYSVSYEETQSN